MSLRLTSTKTKLEEMGEETEFACETLSEYRDVILGLTADTTAPVDIFDANGQYKNTTQIIRELSEVVDQLDTKQLNALMNTLFGKRQGNIGASLLQNFDMVEKSIDIAKKSSEGIGSAMEEQNRWAESLEAKMGKVEAIFESISSKIFDSDSLKGIYDTIIKVMDSIDKVIGNGQGLQLLTGAVGAILGGSGNGFINVNTISGFWVEAEAGISKYNKALTEGKEAQRSVAIEMQKTNVGLSNYLLSLDGAIARKKSYIAYTIKATAASVGLRIATTALNAALNAGIMWLIGTGFSALSAWINHNKEITKSLEETSSKLDNAIESLDDYKSKIDEIASSEEDEHQKLVELNEINDELADKYGLEVEKINDVTKAREALNDALEEEVKRRRAIYLAEGEEAYNIAKNKVSDSYDGNFWGSLFGTASGKESSLNEGTGKFTLRKGFFSEGAEISDRIKELFDNVKEGTNNGLKELKFTLGESARDEIEYFDILEAKVLEFNKIRDNPTIKLTKDEEALYQLMLKQYESLKEHNGDYIENIKNYSRQKALSILDEVKEARYENREAYTAALMLRAGDDRYVKDAIQDLIGATDEAISKAEELANSNPLSILLGNIQKIKNEAKEISEGIQEADESFEKLNKVLDDNENMDNFFSSSEIIELLETYPELSDAILETAYGYKIEEEALETLREARIEEKKTALQAQLDETQGLLEYTNQKLAIYRQELGGIQDVAEARVKLAELEAELAGLSPEAFHHRKSKRNDLEQQRNLYQDFIDTSEAAAKQEAELKKLDTQLAVLGNRYTKATDATKDQTDALKNQKDALSELSKEYDDAQKAIEDLIKLTMDMIMPKGKVRYYWKRWYVYSLE